MGFLSQDALDLGQDLIREGHHAAHAAVEFHVGAAFGFLEHILQHHAGVHFNHQDVIRLFGSLPDGLIREGGQADGAQQPDGQAFSPGSPDG